jgi:hypothetical protein
LVAVKVPLSVSPGDGVGVGVGVGGGEGCDGDDPHATANNRTAMAATCLLMGENSITGFRRFRRFRRFRGFWVPGSGFGFAHRGASDARRA